MAKKIPIAELTRLAFFGGEDYYRTLAESYGYKGEFAQKMLDRANQMRDYRIKRWGKTTHEIAIENAKSVNVEELIKRKTTGDEHG